MKHPRPTETFGNMRKESVHNLLASCLNDACRQQAVIDVSSYPGLDLFELDGIDLRRESWETRRATLASLLRKTVHGIQLTHR
jgi:hypothetical protein